MNVKKLGAIYFAVIFLGLSIVPFTGVEMIEQVCLAAIVVFLYFCFMGELFFAHGQGGKGIAERGGIARSVICAVLLVCAIYFAFDMFSRAIWISGIFSIMALFIVFLGPSIVLNGFSKK